MATIRVDCYDCGDQEVTSDDVTVRVCSANSSGSYTYSCPCCSKIVLKDAEPRIVELLVTSGVRLVTWHLPEELSEIKGLDGPPINHDDLIEFHTEVNTDGWLDEAIVEYRVGGKITEGYLLEGMRVGHDSTHLDEEFIETRDLLDAELRRHLEEIRQEVPGGGPDNNIKNV